MSEEKLQLQCGQWRLTREIGQGAYGVVYLAIGPGGERAAMKVCRRDAIGDERYERELRGAKLYRAIPPQEGLIRMRELVETEWGFFTVMDLADDEFGGSQEPSSGYRPKTLARVIEGEKALPLKECVTLALSLANGLCALQRNHLLHRDIKPGNVIYVKGQPVLSDPGLVVEESNAVSTVGTPGYVPPEKKFTDAASDIYSLGLTLKAASFGRQVEDLDKGPAMEADTGAALFPAWWRILNKATDPILTKRYRSAKAFLKDLKSLRWKMSVSSACRSWLLYAAIMVLLPIIGVYVYRASRERDKFAAALETASCELDNASRERKRLEAEIEPMRKIMAIAKSLNEKSSQDPLAWSSFKGSYFCHIDESHRQRLKRAEEKDPVAAAAMRDILGQMLEIDKKGEENNRRIKDLQEKVGTGQDDSEKYNQAELLSMENEKLVKAWLSLLEKFTLLEDGVKAKE